MFRTMNTEFTPIVHWSQCAAICVKLFYAALSKARVLTNEATLQAKILLTMAQKPSFYLTENILREFLSGMNKTFNDLQPSVMEHTLWE